MTEKKLHLDSEYRNRWQEFHLEDGTIEDSREKNWRQVAWEKVDKIVIHIKGKTHIQEKTAGQVCFMNFRWAGAAAQYRDGKYIGHKKVRIWTLGYTDGKTCFLHDYDFESGDEVKVYREPIEKFKSHIHPNISVTE